MRNIFKSVVVAVCVTALACGFAGCGLLKRTPAAPPPSEVRTAPALASSLGAQSSKASAAVFAATEANLKSVDSPAKVATAGELSVASANLPQPADKDKAEALARVNEALKGDLTKAETQWAKARDDAATLADQVNKLQAQVKQERIDAAKELQKQLQDARDQAKKDADTQQRQIAAYIFYGGAFLLAVGGAVVLGLAGSVPIFGPKLAIALGVAAAASATLGALVNELLSNPWILRTLGGLLVAGVATAIGLAISNHHHAAPAAVSK